MEENYQDVGDLPLDVVKPPIQLPTTNLSETFKKFESNYPQFTKVNSATAPQQETIDQAMDRINNTKLNVNYVPNIVAPVTVDLDAKRYQNVDLTLPEILSGNAEQYAAQTQSYWDRLWNDTKVTGVNFGLGFATAFTSVYDMINDGSFIPGEDSATSNLGKISQNFAEENSNFKTQYDIDNPIKSLLLPAFLTGGSSGWGEITKSASIGLGTTAGIIAQEAAITAATGGIGTFPALAANIRNIIRNSSVLVRAAEVAGGLRAGTMSLGQGAKSILGLETAISAANTTKNVINLSKNAVRSALSAYGESAFEAQETRDTFTAEKVKEFEQLNGRLPNEIEVKRIKDVGEQAHDARFILNFAALSISNMPFNNAIFKQFDDVISLSEQAAAKGLKYTGRAGDGFEKAFQLTSNWWSKNAVTKGMKTAIETGQPFAKNILTGKSITWNEGFEEGYQFWVDKATNNYYNTIYNKGTNNIIDGTFQDTAYGLAKSFYQTKEQLITTEGLQNMIGGILGGTGQSMVARGIGVGKNIYNANKIASDPKNNTTFKEEYDKLTGQWKEGSQFRINATSEIEQGKKDLIDIQKALDLNSITGDIKSKIESVRGAYAGAGLMQETNSRTAFEKLKDITKFHTIAPMVMRGQTEILKDELTKSIRDSTDEEFKALTGLEEVTSGIREKYVSGVLNDIEKVEKSVKRNLSTFRNKFQKGTQEYNLYEDAKKVFAFHGYISENMMERRKELETENSILFNAPNISSALQLIFTDTGQEKVINTINEKIKGLDTVLNTLKPVISDTEIITEDDKELIKSLNAKKDQLEKLKETAGSFKGDTKKEVIDFLIENLEAFDQTDIILNNPNLNAENQLENLLNRYNDYNEISNNIADHLETYNNLVQSYSDSNKLKGVLNKYREQGMVVQSSFEDLKEIDKYNKVNEYFDKKSKEVFLPVDSEMFKVIRDGVLELKLRNAEFEEFKELIDKNIEQYKREEAEQEAEQERKKKEAEKINTSNTNDSILNYKSFTTAKGSIYNILPDGTVQRFKTVLNDPNYLGIDKGENALRKSSDITMFFDEESKIGKIIDYFNNGGLTRNISSQTYLLQGTQGNYKIIKNNLELNLNEDIFLLILPLEVATNIDVENLTSNQIETYTQRFIDAYVQKNNLNNENFKLFKHYYFGKINDNVSFVPKIGLQTFDYKVNQETGLQGNRHIGNKVVSIEKIKTETQTEDDITNLEFLELLKKIQQNVIDDKRVDQQVIIELEQEIETLKGEKEKVENQELNNTKENLLIEIDRTITIINDKIEQIKNTATGNDLDNELDKVENVILKSKLNENQPSNKTIEQLEKEITDIRAQEQIDLNNEIPNFNSFKVDGKLDKNKLLGKDLVNYERIWNEYNTILTPLLAELKAKKAAKEKNKKPTNEKTGKVDTGSIKSKTLESIVYIDDKGKIISLKSPDGKEKGIKTAKKVSDTLQSGEEIDIEDLTFKLVTSTENKTTPLMWDKVFKRTSSEKAIQVTDSSGNFITLIQNSKTLLLNTDYILKNKDIILKPDLRTLLEGNPDISVVDAIKKGILDETLLDETLFDYLKTIKTVTEGKEHSILVVTENFETFKNIILKQSENFEKFLENPKKLKETFKELYSGLETFANGINANKEGNYKEVAFTKGLPFNFIGEWNQPIFSISNNEITPLNGEELGVKRKPLREKINNVLKEIAEKNPNFYEVLINKGSYFTVFTDQNNKIWIKPISLKLDNAKEKIEEQIFQNEKVTEKTAGDVREKYNITTYHNKELVRIKIYEDKYNEKIVNISFSKKVNGETISYYLNKVNKENLTKILNDPSSVKPKLKKPLEGFSNELDLKDSKISIIKNSNKDDRLELITNGDYSVSDIDNPISIFQNVGFRLKFNEKQEEQNPIIPKSFIPETPPIASGKDSNKTEMEVKILEIEERRKANLEDTGDPFDSLSPYPRIDGRFNAIYNMPNKQIENEIFDTYQEAKDWINNKYNAEIKAVKEQYEITADELFAPTSPVQELANISREEIDNKKKELENQPLMNQFEIDNQTKTPVEGLNERLDTYGNAKVLLSNDFFEGKRPAGRLNAFKSIIDKVSDNIVILENLNLDEFDFISEEDKQKLNDLKPLAEELSRINNLTISSTDTRTVAVEKRYAQLSNQLSNDFVAIMNKYVKNQLGKEISSSKPSLIQQSNTETSLQPTVANDNLQEIADYVWNNLFYENPGKEFIVYELKENINFSELNSKFVQYKEAEFSKDPKIRKNKNILKQELLTFFNSKKVQDYTKRGEIPSQRAFLEDNTEIVKQYVINCK